MTSQWWWWLWRTTHPSIHPLSFCFSTLDQVGSLAFCSRLDEMLNRLVEACTWCQFLTFCVILLQVLHLNLTRMKMWR